MTVIRAGLILFAITCWASSCMMMYNEHGNFYGFMYTSATAFGAWLLFWVIGTRVLERIKYERMMKYEEHVEHDPNKPSTDPKSPLSDIYVPEKPSSVTLDDVDDLL